MLNELTLNLSRLQLKLKIKSLSLAQMQERMQVKRSLHNHKIPNTAMLTTQNMPNRKLSEEILNMASTVEDIKTKLTKEDLFGPYIKFDADNKYFPSLNCLYCSDNVSFEV